MQISIIILAGGSGTRMKSDTPKVLHTICGKSMIDYSLEVSKKLSDDIHVVVYHQKERIQEHLKDKNITFHTQDHKNFPGTGGALRDITTKHENILVLNGDMPLVTQTSLKQFTTIDSDINIGVIKTPSPYGYGRIILQNDEVGKIVEEKDASDEIKKINTINSGVYLFKKEILEKYIPLLSNKNAQKEYYLTDIIELAKNDNKTIKPIFVNEDDFRGVNSKQDLANAEVIMSNRIKNNLMNNGIKMILPDTIYIHSDVKIAGECTIESGVSILGSSNIQDSHIKSNTVIEDSIITSSSIGPMARIRPNSNIKDSQIGNFVEIKNSTLNGVKSGHLSYLGDSSIDTGSNIGAGTITCNYDGMKKYKTTIGKNVFIGSDTQLIAPIKIEDDVLIAAGSTITTDVKKGSLAISRVKQSSIKDFFYKFFKKSK